MQKLSETEVMNMEEFADFLRITETTAYQLVRSGAIPGRKVGREWRFLRSEVLAWLRHSNPEKKGSKEMDHVVYRDEWGGEYKVVGGEEQIALWLPLSRKEKEALIAKAGDKKVKVSEMVASYLKDWIQEK